MAEETIRHGEFLNGKLWFESEDGLVTVGLTSCAIDELGELEDISLPDEGEDFSKGEVIAIVEGSKGNLEILMPLAGVVESVNGCAAKEPDRVAEDPLEEGWLIKIKLENPNEFQNEF